MKRQSFSKSTQDYFDQLGRDGHPLCRRMAAYQSHTRALFAQMIPENQRILMVGCWVPDLLPHLNPREGLGIDVSASMVERAKKHSMVHIRYRQCAPEDLKRAEPFDYIVLPNTVDYTDDLLFLLGELRKLTHLDTKVVFSMVSPLWHSLVRFASWIGVRIPDAKRNIVAAKVLEFSLRAKGFEITERFERVLCPKRIPVLAFLLNHYVARLPGVRRLCFLKYVVAKPRSIQVRAESRCSVLIPCFNEEANLEACVARVPPLGPEVELLLINDGSTDNTPQVMDRLARQDTRVRVLSFEKNQGKGRAVWEGIQKAHGEVILILDADMTVPPEELVDFYEAIETRAAEFVAGSRFFYPMQKGAMRGVNFAGNYLFSSLVQIIVGAKRTDALCGTKAFLRRDFLDLKMEDTAWGDFDLIFHAAQRKLASGEIPVHYQSRTAGVSKMRSVESGLGFLRLCAQKWAELN